MEELASLLGWLIIDVLLINTGRAAVFALSLGRWRGERLGRDEGQVHGMAGALSFKVHGRRVITRSGLVFVGVAVYAAVAVALVAAASA